MKDKYFLTVILLGFAILFATTLLLDLQWIKKNVVRQLIVYLLLILELFIFYQKLFNHKIKK